MKTGMKKWLSLILAALICLALVGAYASEATTELAPGSKGEAVTEMQERLIQLGYFFAPADGTYGKTTEEAIMRFQEGNSLEATGLTDEALLALLYSDDAQPAASAAYLESGVLNRSIALTSEDTVVYSGKALPLTGSVEALTEDAPAKTALAWFSADSSIATVSGNGQVKGVAPGKVLIYCYAKDDPRIAASLEVEVRTAAKTIALDAKTLNLLIGESTDHSSAALICTIGPEEAYDHSVIWSSSDETVATVDENGVVTAVGAGSATITATPGDTNLTRTATCTVKVTRSVDSVTLSSENEMVYVGKKHTLTAAVLPEDAANPKLVWESSDPAIAAVDKNGNVTGKKTGTATITAATTDGSEISVTCQVQVITAVKTITLSTKNHQLVLGSVPEAAQLQLTCQTAPEDAHYQAVTWTSSDETIATVDENGLVQALAPGEVTITATTTDPSSTASASAKIIVGDAVQSITGLTSKVTVQKGKSHSFSVTAAPETALNKAVVWSSSKENIATVDKNGKVVGKGVGTVTITAEAADGSGVKATCEVTVIQPVTKLSASSDSKPVVFSGKTTTLRVSAAPTDATNKKVSWSSSDTYVATVDENGKVTGKHAGTATITAKAKDGSGKTCTFRLTVEPAVPISLDSMGFGIYQPNLLGITVTNKCKTKAIVNFSFDLELKSYDGSVINSGSFNLGKDVNIGKGATRTIKRNVYGVGYAYQVNFTITGVTFSDGTYYSIPYDMQRRQSFRRR